MNNFIAYFYNINVKNIIKHNKYYSFIYKGIHNRILTVKKRN